MRLKKNKEKLYMATPSRALSSRVDEKEARDEMDKLMSDILEVVRMSQEAQQVGQSYEHGSRRIISLEDYYEEVNLVRY